jgi:PAS domain-containing protein
MPQLEKYDAQADVPERYAALVLDAFDAAPYELDLRSSTLRPTPRLNALLGFPTDHPLSVADFDARLHPDDCGTMEWAITDAITTTTDRFQCTYRVRLPSGVTRWLFARGAIIVDATDQPVLVRGAVIDISERQWVAQAARDSEELFHQMADTLPQMIGATNSNGQVGFLNQRWYDYSDTPKVAITAAGVAANSVHPDDVPKLMAAFTEAIRTGQGLRGRAA